MDIYCTNCGEPWDLDCLHQEIECRIIDGILTDPQGDDYANYYRSLQHEFATKGCKAFTAAYPSAGGHCQPQESLSDNGKLTKSAAMAALLEICGDDFDGIASMMDDFEYVGWVE